MKRVVVLFILLFFLSSVSAIKITEVESNPTGTDAGYEWVELYSNSEANLGGYKLVNNDGGEIALEGNFSGYYVYTFSSQWLDNTDEKVLLYHGEDLIDATDVFADSKNSAMTWQICSGSWEMKISTRKSENECGTEEEEEAPEEEPPETTIDDSEDEEPDEPEENTDSPKVIEYITITSKVVENKTRETIHLNPKDIKSEGNTFNLDKSNFAILGFVGFCILILLLFILKKNKYRKNEFT